MNRSTDDKLDPKAKSKESEKTDFDRNRKGLYGGLPQVRERSAEDSNDEKSQIGSS